MGEARRARGFEEDPPATVDVGPEIRELLVQCMEHLRRRTTPAERRALALRAQGLRMRAIAREMFDADVDASSTRWSVSSRAR